MIHRLEQRPGAHVRHAKALGRCRQRARLINCLEQFRFAGAERDIIAAQNTQAWPH